MDRGIWEAQKPDLQNGHLGLVEPVVRPACPKGNEGMGNMWVETAHVVWGAIAPARLRRVSCVGGEA